MTFTTEQLLAELHNPPTGMTYDLSGNGDAAVAAALNANTGAGAGPVSRGIISMDWFMTYVGDGISKVIAAGGATLAKYQPLLYNMNIPGVQYMNMDMASVQGALASMVADTLITQAEATNALTYTGSRAEVLWGAGTVVAQSDVATALYPERLTVFQTAQAALATKADQLASQYPNASRKELLERADQALNNANWGWTN